MFNPIQERNVPNVMWLHAYDANRNCFKSYHERISNCFPINNIYYKVIIFILSYELKSLYLLFCLNHSIFRINVIVVVLC